LPINNNTHSIITGDNGGKSFIPGKLETSWVDELTDYADTFLEDEETRQGNILNNKTCSDCSSFPSFAAALFVPSDDLSLLKCEDKTKSLITASEFPGKLETSWVDELTDYADTFLEDEETRQGNILNNKTKEIGQSLMLLIKEGNSEAVIRDLVLSSHFSKLNSSLQLVSNFPGMKDLPPLSPVIIE
jgi:hypothetical protein